MKREIKTPEDVRLLVDTFYQKVNKDELLSPVFNDQAHVDWQSHLPKMYQFWNMQLLGISGYKGQPFPPHAMLHINEKHFECWQMLFMETVDELFKGLVAEMAKQKARNIARVFQYKLGLIKE